jgi:deazaflavin-dependent oxidoreductase (nitroreductase family)
MTYEFDGDMQLPQWLARFNRHVTNPIQRLWAGWAPTMGILEHVGRRSGTPYRTPLTVFSTDEGVAVLLTYGPNRDWLKNLTAAGRGRMQRYGKTFEVTEPQVMSKAEAAPAVKGLWRPIFSILPFEKALLLRRAS